MGKTEKTEKDRERLKIDLRKVSGIQFDPEAKEITSGVIDEIDYIRGIVSHLWDNPGLFLRALGNPNSEVGVLINAILGADLIFGWVDSRLTAVSNHIESVLKEKRESHE